MASKLQLGTAFIHEMVEASSSNLVEQLLKLAQDFSVLKGEKEANHDALVSAHHTTLCKLARVAASKDDDTGVHITRVGYLSEYLCHLLNKPQDFCFMVRLAAPMHDIGKVGVPDDILKKRGALTVDERLIMNQHAEIGEKILMDELPLFKLAALISLTHHEKYDGTGYPRGLAKEAIPLVGRIVALVDFFDALTMDRCYRKAFSYEETYQQIEKLAGTHFDPAVTEVFLKHYKQFERLKKHIDQKAISYEQMLKYSALSFFDK